MQNCFIFFHLHIICFVFFTKKELVGLDTLFLGISLRTTLNILNNLKLNLLKYSVQDGTYVAVLNMFHSRFSCVFLTSISNGV